MTNMGRAYAAVPLVSRLSATLTPAGASNSQGAEITRAESIGPGFRITVIGIPLPPRAETCHGKLPVSRATRGPVITSPAVCAVSRRKLRTAIADREATTRAGRSVNSSLGRQINHVPPTRCQIPVIAAKPLITLKTRLTITGLGDSALPAQD
jgi:hypothetical protein